jgi:5-oxoprolinase (ATP-hydrolysing)
MTVAILANSRRIAPFGMDGGQPGQPGRTTLARVGERVEEFGSCAKMEVNCGDAIIVETPGGGGFGSENLFAD